MYRRDKEYSSIDSSQFKNKFQIIDDIDQGTYGIVYKGKDKQNNMTVAIKKLKDNSALATMIGQAKTMKKISHPNILKCVELYYVRDKLSYYLITPFCSNGSLRSNIQQIFKKDTTFKMNLCLEIADGIQALHDKNIMHRDISPGNILFDENWTSYLCDFGFSKTDTDSEQSISVGTQAFRDPNIATGKYSRKCDIYSFGLIADYIFRGDGIFFTKSQTQYKKLYLNFMNNKQRIIGQLNCPKQLKQLILKCVESDQNRRLNSFELVDELYRIMKINKIEIKKRNQESMIKSIISETQEQKKQMIQRKFNNLIQPNPNLKARHTMFQQSDIRISVQNSSDEEYCSQIINPYSYQQIPNTKQTIKTYNTTINKNQHVNSTIDNSTQKKQSKQQINQYVISLMKSQKQCNNTIKKIQNFSKVYQFFLLRRNKIRDINQVCNLEGITHRNKCMIIFIVFFSYIRFLKVYKAYLQNIPSSQISSVNGITRNNMSPKTIEVCLDLIASEKKTSIHAVKRFINQLYLQRKVCKDQIPKTIIEMIVECKDKSFDKIQKFSNKKCKQQLSNILNNIFLPKNTQQQNVRKKIVSLSYLIVL